MIFPSLLFIEIVYGSFAEALAACFLAGAQSDFPKIITGD